MFRKYFILSLLTTILSLWTVASSTTEAAGCGRAKLFSGKVFSGQARERAKNTVGKLLPRNWERNK